MRTRERPGRAGGHSAAMAAAPGKPAADSRRRTFPRRERRGIYGLMLTMAIVAVIILVMVGWAVTLREGARVSALQTTLTQAEAETRRLFSSFTNYSGDIDALVSSAMPTRARDGDTIVTPWGTTIEIGGGNTPGTQAAATVASTANRFWIQIDNLGEDACKKIAAAYQNNPGVLSVTDGTAAQTAADIDTPAEIESDCDGDTDLAIVFRG
ncbi:MAG: hypothetical protein F4219_05055 [Gammaproteobacteria bacterium]|nr:hypothetical protein [Gammaproteobacteria bacterium]